MIEQQRFLCVRTLTGAQLWHAIEPEPADILRAEASGFPLEWFTVERMVNRFTAVVPPGCTWWVTTRYS